MALRSPWPGRGTSAPCGKGNVCVKPGGHLMEQTCHSTAKPLARNRSRCSLQRGTMGAGYPDGRVTSQQQYSRGCAGVLPGSQLGQETQVSNRAITIRTGDARVAQQQASLARNRSRCSLQRGTFGTAKPDGQSMEQMCHSTWWCRGGQAGRRAGTGTPWEWVWGNGAEACGTRVLR